VHASFDLPWDFAAMRIPHSTAWASRVRVRCSSPPDGAGLDALIQKEGPDTIAAMFVEPVMGAGGPMVRPMAILMPSPKY